MALVDDVKKGLIQLMEREPGWEAVFSNHGWSFDAATLAGMSGAELSDKLLNHGLNVNRTKDGFQDFAAGGDRMVSPGQPARSLLYHAMASPAVHPSADNTPLKNAKAYPTVSDLDTIENFIYSVAEKKISDFENPVVAVFAYQYRVGTRTPHGVHADVAYSRTGISRVGTHESNYQPALRRFWPVPEATSEGIAVLPARFGIFLAETRRGGDASFSILKPDGRDFVRRFLVPVHKLFPGDECLRDETISAEEFQCLEFHINEKLRKTHRAPDARTLPVFPGFDIDKPPFVRDSKTTKDLVTIDRNGASFLVLPQAPKDKRLVRVGTQRNSNSGRDETIRYRVPSIQDSRRFWTSLFIRPQGNGRAAPEYVNMRQRVDDPTAGVAGLKDINTFDAADFRDAIADGDFDAAHFLDDSCDGVIEPQVKGSKGAVDQLPRVSAYSLVTAPDFFPLADQIDIQNWADESLSSVTEHFAQGGPRPLNEGRRFGRSEVNGIPQSGRTPNPALPLPSNEEQPAFDRNDLTSITIGAVTSAPPSSNGAAIKRRNVQTGFLPDAASDVFAPGWDISQHGDNQGQFYHNYGLGSPFPEDAKLCAALNSFWPAAAPDVARTFGDRTPPTALPLLDEELGLHPRHPRVVSGEVDSKPGWDGEFGPFLELIGGDFFVNFVDGDRSDYTRAALDGRITISGLVHVDSDELIDRMNALRSCIHILTDGSTPVSRTDLWLTGAEKVAEWKDRPDRGNPTLVGPGYVYLFVRLARPRQGIPSGELIRSRLLVDNRFTCQLSNTHIATQENDDAFSLDPSPF